jgi:hypothetical protein
LFVIYFVHNVAATVSYDRKEFLDIRTVITHLKLYKDFSLMSLTEGYTVSPGPGPNPHHVHEEKTEIQRVQIWVLL